MPATGAKPHAERYERLFLSVDWNKAERIRQKRNSHVIGAYS